MPRRHEAPPPSAPPPPAAGAPLPGVGDPDVSAPVRRNGRETLERIVAATERLLEQRPFEEIEVDDIVREARASVGSFYARFRGKHALLPYLYARYDAELRVRLPQLVQSLGWREAPLPTLCDEVVTLLVALFRERRQLLRAVALHARSQPAAIDQATRAARSVLLEGPVRLFARHLAAVRGDADLDAEQRVAFALFAVAAVCRETILFSEAPHAATLQLSDAVLARQLSRMLLAYLTCDPAEPRA